jgi:hypothetical protein
MPSLLNGLWRTLLLYSLMDDLSVGVKVHYPQRIAARGGPMIDELMVTRDGWIVDLTFELGLP